MPAFTDVLAMASLWNAHDLRPNAPQEQRARSRIVQRRTTDLAEICINARQMWDDAMSFLELSLSIQSVKT